MSCVVLEMRRDGAICDGSDYMITSSVHKFLSGYQPLLPEHYHYNCSSRSISPENFVNWEFN